MTASVAARQFETGRLLLRAPEPRDVDRIAEILCDEQVVRWLARAPWPYERRHAEDWIAGAAEAAAAGEERTFAIVHHDLIGMIGLRDIKTTPQLGYWLARRWWGRGLMTEAVRAVVAFAFEALEIDTITSGVFDGNAASLAIQHKVGFVETGRSRVQSLFHGRELPHIDTVLTRTAHSTNQS